MVCGATLLTAFPLLLPFPVAAEFFCCIFFLSLFFFGVFFIIHLFASYPSHSFWLLLLLSARC